MAAIFNLAGNRNKRKAILEYNDALDKKTSFKLVPIGTANGIETITKQNLLVPIVFIIDF
jgi:hypothetical protein